MLQYRSRKLNATYLATVTSSMLLRCPGFDWAAHQPVVKLSLPRPGTFMKRALSYPEPVEGRPFSLRDLRAALAWAESRPGVRLHIMSDHPDIIEVIEIYPPAYSSPRWLLWNTSEGRLRVGDLTKGEFDLPYPTLEAALRFIGSTPTPL
jgi:hypothetical protein